MEKAATARLDSIFWAKMPWIDVAQIECYIGWWQKLLHLVRQSAHYCFKYAKLFH
jgi:hypothetical protein